MIGDKIRKLRTSKNMTQNDLAQKCGLNRNSIYKYEKNETIPKVAHILEIANALETPITELMDTPYDIFEAPEYAIDKWLYSHGYKMEYGLKEGIHLVDTSNNTTYELEVGQLNYLEKTISDYTKFQVQELLKNCHSLPLKQEGA